MNRADEERLQAQKAEVNARLMVGEVVHIGELPFGYDVAPVPKGPPSEDFLRYLATLGVE